MKKLLAFCLTAVMLLSILPAFVYADSSEALTLFYDDYYTFSEAGSVVSSDTNILSVSGNTLHAVGITAEDPVKITVDSREYSVTVKKAKLNIAVVAGQSNASGETTGVASDVLAKYQRVLPERGTAYLWQENAAAPVDFNDGKAYYKGGFRGALAAEWYALSSEKGAPEKTVVVYGTNYTATPGEKIAEWVSSDSSKARLDKTAAMFNACYDYYTLGAGAEYYELLSCGMYWLQGESDKTQTTEYYYNAFSSLWRNLKQETENHLTYCAFMRVRGSKNSDCSLNYSGPVVAQYQLANDNSDIFTATNITEGLVADKASDLQNTVSLDVSKYHLFGQAQYADIVKNGVLTEQISAFYGGLHYSYLGYAVIGADAAYNMYHSLREPKNAITVATASGALGESVSYSGGQVDITQISSNILLYAAPGSAATTVKATVACTGDGARDITKAVLNGISSSDTAFLMNSERLLGYVDPVVSVQTSLGTVSVKLLTGVTENPEPFGEADTNGVYYHFDFTDARNYKKGLDDNKTIASGEALKIKTASDSTAYGVMEYNSAENTGLCFDEENGLTRETSSSNMFFVYNKEGEKGISATLTNGFVIELTASFASDKHAGILLGSYSSGTNGAHPYLFRYNNDFTMGGSTPSVKFTLSNGSVDYTKSATYRFEYNNGALKLIITQGESRIEAEGVIRGELTESFYTFKTFMPNFSDEYNFKGSVSDLKIWTSYYYGVEFNGSPSSTYTVSGITDGVCADKNEFTIIGNGVYKVESVFAGETELIPDENGVYMLSGVSSDVCLTVNTRAQVGEHTVDDGTVVKQPDCTSAGIKRYSCTDSDCDFYYDEEISALGHDMDAGVVKYAPTANGMGLKAYSCKRQGCSHSEEELLPALSPTYYHWDFTDSSTYDTSDGYKLKTAFDSEAFGYLQYTSSDTSELGYSSTLGIVRENESTSAFEIINSNSESGITLSLTNGFAIEFTAAFKASGYSILLGKTNKQGQGHPYIFKSAAKSFTIGGVSPKASFTVSDSSFSASSPATYLFTCDGEHFRMKVTQNGRVCYDDYLVFDTQVQESHFSFAYLFPNFKSGNNFSGSISDLKLWTSYCVEDTDLAGVTSDLNNWYAASGQYVSQIASATDNGSLCVNGGTLCSKLFKATGAKQGKYAVIKLKLKGNNAQLSILKDGVAAALDTTGTFDDYTEFITSPVVLDRADNLLSLEITANGVEISEITLMYLDEGGIFKPVNTDGTPYKYDYGDVNCDGIVDLLDLVRMKKKLAGISGTNIYLAAANLTRKSEPLLDSEDMALLVKKIISL